MAADYVKNERKGVKIRGEKELVKISPGP